ncbi:OmpA family protein [Mucilaginibacter sp. JRF]|uniref:OmpA family protein n=1 Tax=Mucilaginibacter sp. JRF TaxID=2780088 RepID=UPI00187F2E0B|nr:OmpA family protein [Mucilaginibacter sp. JRF]MBE9586210.1 OmpA family protein [Mucilaginibacter sp. JRF]
MATTNGQQKKSTPVWVWLLIIAVIAVIFFLVRGCGGDEPPVDQKPDNTTPIAVTAPDTSTIDFQSPVVKDADIKDPSVIMSGNDRYTIYSMGENILFAKGDTALLGGADASLQKVAISINKRFQSGHIRIYGSTDNTGEAKNNQVLGKARAMAVKHWLVNYGKVDADLISIHSFGEHEPVASNATPQGQALNRNVSIVAFPAEK